IGGGFSVSTSGTNNTPHAPLSWMSLLSTVSNRPPEIRMPVPTGLLAAMPLLNGVFGLLLSCTELWTNSQHEWVPVGPVSLRGQWPDCGDGWSSLFWLLVANPVWLESNSEFWMIRCPPELVP